jgi:hypothetical protein
MKPRRGVRTGGIGNLSKPAGVRKRKNWGQANKNLLDKNKIGNV